MAGVDNERRRLPAGWRWVKLDQVCVRNTGQRDPRAQPDEPFRYVDISSVDNLSKRIVDARTLMGRDAPSRARQMVRSGDVIVATTRPNLNAVALIPPEFNGQICSTGFCVLRALEGLAPEYLFAYVQSREFVETLSGLVVGALYPAVTDRQVREQVIPLPPLPEQRRIAAMLDDRLAAVDRARAAAQAQLEAAKGLPAVYLRTVFSNPEAQKWPRRRLGEVLRLRKEVVHPRDQPCGPAVFVGLEHIESVTGFRTGSLAVEMAELSGRKPRFHTGDIVYGYLRPYLNKVWIAEFDGLCSVDQYVYSVDTQRADTAFVAWFMRSPVYLERAPIGTTPGQLPRIRTEEVAGVELNLPPLAEQRRIAAATDRHLTDSKRLCHTLEARLELISRLPAALLRQAFNGEL